MRTNLGKEVRGNSAMGIKMFARWPRELIGKTGNNKVGDKGPLKKGE
jgi:hypothetical protein